MFRSLLFLVAFLYCCTAKAQPPLCISKGTNGSAANFKTGELTKYLHLDKYKIIFFGEQHNRVFDPEVKYQLITEANQVTGNRHVFMEVSVSNAWHYNKYLQTGDTSYLYRRNSNKKPGPYAIFWHRLYAYNKQLPDSAKLVIHGVDFERTDVFQTLKELSQGGKPIPASLLAVMDTIDAHIADPPLAMWNMANNKFTLYDNSGFIKTLRYVQSQLLANADDTKKYFGENYPVVYGIITNNSKVEVKANNRNKTMFAAMQKIVAEQRVERLIGFFGNMHTSYSVANSLSNTSRKLKGINGDDILNICEMAYDSKSTDTAFRIKHYHEVVALNGACRATVLPATVVPGHKNKADFVMIANVEE